MPPPDRSEPCGESVRGPWIVLAVAFALVALVRFHRLDLPLERDEGEYAYGARLVCEGEFSYDALRTLKLPGVHLALAPFLSILGAIPAALRVALLAFDVGSALVLFFLARRFVGAWTAALAAAVLALAQTSLCVLGLFAHAENFALLPALAGLLLAVRAAQGGTLLAWSWSGLAFGVAYVMKQPALVFGALGLGAAVLALRARGARFLPSRAALFTAGGALPWGLVCLWMAASGHFETFWFSTVTYARAYGSGATWTQGWKHLAAQLSDVGTHQPALAALALAGCVALGLRRELRGLVRPLVGLALAGLLATSVGLYFRAHYFVFLLPAAAICAALGAEALAAWTVRAARARVGVATALVALAAAAGGFLERDVLWTEDPLAVSRRLYFPNPFADSAQLAEIIRARTRPSDTIGVLGSEPQIPFLADRRSATGFVYMYPLLEEHEHAAWMQDRAIAELEAAKPRILVVVNVRISWLRRPQSVTRIFEWYPPYLERHYRLVGVLDLASPAGSRWLDANSPAEAAAGVQSCVLVYERTPGS